MKHAVSILAAQFSHVRYSYIKAHSYAVFLSSQPAPSFSIHYGMAAKQTVRNVQRHKHIAALVDKYSKLELSANPPVLDNAYLRSFLVELTPFCPSPDNLEETAKSLLLKLGITTYRSRLGHAVSFKHSQLRRTQYLELAKNVSAISVCLCLSSL